MTGEGLVTAALSAASAYAAYLMMTGHLVPRREIELMRRDLERTAALARARHGEHMPKAVTHSGHDVVPVETGGETVAHLCVTCDEQLPAGWRPAA